MLTKLLPENVTNNWGMIKFAIQQSLPPFAIDTPDKMNRILESIILGELEVWVYHEVLEGNVKIKTIVSTKILTDPESKTKNLLIYSIYNYDHLKEEDWELGYQALVDYAKANECQAITGFTVDPFVLKYVEGLGGNTDVRFIRLPI